MARNFHMAPKQSELLVTMENQSKAYQDHLNNWYNNSNNQLQLIFANSASALQQQSKEKELEEIQTILDKGSQYFKDMSSLDNDAYLQVLAVFFNSKI